MNSNISSRVNRRTALKGLGTAIVGLPLLEEMVAAKASAVPVRAFNVFFGLGIPSPLQTEGFADVFEPLKPLKEKLLIMRNVDQVRADEKGINAHFDGASAAFTAEGPDGEAKAGGPSIDQVIRRTVHPNGMPAGMVPTLVAGTFFRRSRVSRYVHSYNPDGTVAAMMQERPREVFERVFGMIDTGKSDPRRDRLKRSVLDTMVDQYKFFTGKNSPGSANTWNASANTSNEPTPCGTCPRELRRCRPVQTSPTAVRPIPGGKVSICAWRT